MCCLNQAQVDWGSLIICYSLAIVSTIVNLHVSLWPILSLEVMDDCTQSYFWCKLVNFFWHHFNWANFEWLSLTHDHFNLNFIGTILLGHFWHTHVTIPSWTRHTESNTKTGKPSIAHWPGSCFPVTAILGSCRIITTQVKDTDKLFQAFWRSGMHLAHRGCQIDKVRGVTRNGYRTLGSRVCFD